MGVGTQTFFKTDDSANTKTKRIAELKENIQKDEYALPEHKAIIEKYFNSFWRMKSDSNNLSQEENRSSEVEAKIKELNNSINGLEEILQKIKPEEKIQQLEKNIEIQKKELQRLSYEVAVDEIKEKLSSVFGISRNSCCK